MADRSLINEIQSLLKEREALEKILLEPSPMIKGSYHEKLKKCGKPQCCCSQGKLHGPFAYLTLSSAAKVKVLFIRQDEQQRVRLLAERYKRYQECLSRWRKIAEELSRCYNLLRDSYTEIYNNQEKPY